MRAGCDCRNDGSLNPASIEGIRLDHEYGPPVSGIGATRFRKVRHQIFPHASGSMSTTFLSGEI